MRSSVEVFFYDPTDFSLSSGFIKYIENIVLGKFVQAFVDSFPTFREIQLNLHRYLSFSSFWNIEMFVGVGNVTTSWRIPQLVPVKRENAVF